MTRRPFTRDDWLDIKKKQGRNWRKMIIAAHTGWSEDTVKRAMKSRTWQEYRRMIRKATESIRRRRAAEAWQRRDDLIEEPKPKHFGRNNSTTPAYVVGLVILFFIGVIWWGIQLSKG